MIEERLRQMMIENNRLRQALSNIVNLPSLGPIASEKMTCQYLIELARKGLVGKDEKEE